LQQLVHGGVPLAGTGHQGPLAAVHVPQPVRPGRERGGQLVPPLDLAESVLGVAVHSALIVTAAGAEIAVHQPAFPASSLRPEPRSPSTSQRFRSLCAKLPSYFWGQ